MPLLVLTARSDLAFKAALPAFEAQVQSCTLGPSAEQHWACRLTERRTRRGAADARVARYYWTARG